jgi:rubrerythrin
MSRSLIKAYNALKAENARLKSELDKLRQEYHGNEYDDMIEEHLKEQEEMYRDNTDCWQCHICGYFVPLGELCSCQL